MSKKKTSRFGSNVVADVERRKAEQGNYGYLKLPKGVNIFKESEGSVKLDIIPYIVKDEQHMDIKEDRPDGLQVGKPWYKKPILVHRGIGTDNESLICPRTKGKKCPICEHRSKQQQQQVEKDDLISKAQLRNLYLVIPIGHKKYDEKIHLFNIADGNFQECLDEEVREKPEHGVFPDPEEGETLKVRFSEETFGKNKFQKATRVDFEERKEQYDPTILDDAPNLDELITVMSYKDIEKILMDLSDDDVVPEEDDDKKSKKGGTSASSYRKRKTTKEEEEVEEEEPEPEEEEEEEEPEEEEEKPKRSSGGMTRKESPKSSNGKGGKEECPYGHKFGKDWDEFDDCDDCKLFEACGKSNELITK